MKIRSVFQSLLVLTLCLAMSCAQVVRGSRQAVSFGSNQPGAVVRTMDGSSCVTPCQLELKRNKNHMAVISKPGFKEQSIAISSQLNGGWLAGDIVLMFLVWGPFGLISLAGGWWDLVPANVYFTLEPERAASAPTSLLISDDRLRVVCRRQSSRFSCHLEPLS